MRFKLKSQITNYKLQTNHKPEITNHKRVWNFGHGNFHRKSAFGGFTMVEVVVMSAIIVTISAIVLGGFTGFNEGSALSRGAREVALSVRRAQNMALAVTQIQAPGGFLVPPAFGAQFSTVTPGKYFIFADLDNNARFTASDVKVGQDFTFERNVAIESLVDDLGISRSAVHVIFRAPEANPTITDSAGVSLGSKIEITLKTSTGTLRRTITVRTSGQINIK